MMKRILVTGGGRGIGRATAILCGVRRWSVGINYVRDSVAAEEAAQAVQAAGGSATMSKGDVTVEADVISIFDAVEATLGRLDGVVINAGIVAPSLQLADMTSERLRRMFEVNVYGAYLCARESAPTAVERPWRQGRLDRSGIFRGESLGVAVRICGLCRIQGSVGYIDYRSGQGAGPAGSACQCGSARPD